MQQNREHPLVSIIIPVYNSEKYLADCIRSAIAQTWANKEIIIVNDGSTDNSLQIAKSFAGDTVKIFTQENKGAAIARNKGLAEAKGDYVQFLDADDYLSKDKIEGQVITLNGSTTHISLCKTMFFYDGEESILHNPREDWYYADHNDTVDFLIKLNSVNEIMQGYGGMVQPNSWLTPMRLIEKAGVWKEFRSPDDDGEFFCRVILASEGIKFSDTGFNHYRRFRNQNSLSGQKSLQAYESFLLALNLKHSHLKSKTANPILDKIFARQLWWLGVEAYPKFIHFSELCTRKARQLGFSGREYVGGPDGHKLAAILGWKFARFISYYTQLLKKTV
jgi:glycosyltransferase involved in cell wall biosynthesis